MNKSIKKTVAMLAMGAVVATTLLGRNIITSSADEVEKKYVRDNHLGVNEKGDLVITRNELGNEPMGKQDAWTIFVYMCGSDLESWGGSATLDIKEMIAANTNENVNIIIQTGGASEWQEFGISSKNIERYIVDENTLKKLESLPNASMAEASTLENFVSWGVEKYPAEHMGMIYWNHGGGSIYGACSDENYEGMLTLSEFEMAMSNATKKMTDKFDFIGFDACLMATIEAANTFVPYAEYMIASEESESATGWTYTEIVNALVANPDLDVKELGKVIINSFIEDNIKLGTEDMATLSMTDLSKIDAVLVEFNKVAKKMYEMSATEEDMTLFTKLAYMAENYSEGSGFDMIDFTDYMLNIVDLIPEAQTVADLMEAAIVYERHGEIFMDTKGLTFYYCYGNMTMSDMNILRNITISPYLLNFIEKLAYGAIKDGSIEGFTSNSWEKNEYYYDENYDFVKYEFQEMLDYSEVLCNSEYFKKATFDEVWYEWFKDFDNFDYYEDFEDYEYDGIYAESDEDDIFIDEDAIVVDMGIDVNLNLGSGIELHGVTLTNDFSLADLRKVAKANYKVVVNDGTTRKVIGDLGSIEENASYTGTWFALSNGSLINAEKMNEGNGLTMYKANVLIDGKDSFIYFVSDKKNNVLVLGTWSGMDKKNKSAGRIMPEIKDGAVITPVYTTITSNGKVIKTVGEEVVARGKVIKPVELKDCSFIVEMTDAFGNKNFR